MKFVRALLIYLKALKNRSRVEEFLAVIDKKLRYKTFRFLIFVSFKSVKVIYRFLQLGPTLKFHSKFHLLFMMKESTQDYILILND